MIGRENFNAIVLHLDDATKGLHKAGSAAEMASLVLFDERDGLSGKIDRFLDALDDLIGDFESIVEEFEEKIKARSERG